MSQARNCTALFPSAALVMLMGSSLYREGAARKFFDFLDLSSGAELYARCQESCPWYDEVILNRKFMIHSMVRKIIESSTEPCQVILPAAGMSPLALQLVTEFDEKQLPSILEIDIEGMAEKSRMYQQIVPREQNRFISMSGDITRIEDLVRVGETTNPHWKTILVLEGITYYLTAEEIEIIIRHLTRQGTNSTVIVEYMQPCSEISGERRKYPREIFRHIREHCSQQSIYSYSQEEIASIIRSGGGDTPHHFSMKEMEAERTGRNEYFRSDEDGWIWCCVGNIR